jgi:uncharacterized protein (DUF1800 family)
MKPMVFTRDQPIDPVTGQPWINNGTPTDTVQPSLRHYVRNWVLNEMRYDERYSHSKMLFFLHKCMVVNSNTNTSERFYDYLALIFKYTTGSFKTLAKKMTKDNLMLIYLNNTDNKKTAPNENYAREFLELFTIGKGPQIAPGNYTNYTEQDVVVGAKLLTGIRLDTNGEIQLIRTPAYRPGDLHLMCTIQKTRPLAALLIIILLKVLNLRMICLVSWMIMWK